MSDQPAITVADAIRLLNDINAADPTVLPALISYRVPCNEALADHPTVQVGKLSLDSVESDARPYAVGLLGILNGLFGARPDGTGWIVALFDNLDGTIAWFDCMAADQAGGSEATT